jgi:hypothetical protein
MFSFFKEKTLEQQAVKELKKLRKDIMKAGGPEKVCYLFWKHLENNSFYHDAGVVSEEESPYSKFIVILASLDLLNSWKKTPNDDPSIKELMELLSKQAYVAGLLTLNHSELTDLYEKIGVCKGESPLILKWPTPLNNN